MNTENEKPWGNLQSRTTLLIQEIERRFIVIVDDNYHVYWETTDEYDDQGHKDRKAWNDFLNNAALVEAVPFNHFSKDIRLNFARLIGEAHVRALEHDYLNAKKMLEEAANYVNRRNQEQSRDWYLSASGVTAIAVVFIGSLIWLYRTQIIATLGYSFTSLLMAGVFGAMGAIFSIILRMGKSNLDSSSGRRIHYLEGVSRIAVGSISGIVSIMAIKSGFIVPAFLKAPNSNWSIMLFALIAGISERLIPSIISRFEKPNHEHPDKQTDTFKPNVGE